jgi:hypothetical protein
MAAPYTQDNYGSRPFIPYPQSNENRWKPAIMPPTNKNSEKPLEANKTLTEQVASHDTMKQLHKSLASKALKSRDYNTRLLD